MTCEDARVALGALVIGALDDDEVREVEAHLETCAECRAEYEELRLMPRLLGLVTLQEATNGPVQPPPRLREDIVRSAVVHRRAERRRRIGWTTGGGVAIAAAAAAIGFGVADGTAVADPAAPEGQVLAGEDSATGVRGQVLVDGVGWGTKLALELAGVAPGEQCQLVAVSTSGSRQVTATWTVPAATSADKYLNIPGAAGLTPGDIQQFDVVTSGGTAVFSVTFDDLVSDVPVAGQPGH